MELTLSIKTNFVYTKSYIMKKILVINANPQVESLSGAFANEYIEGAVSSGGQCKLINLVNFDFDPVLKNGYTKKTEMEPDLIQAQNGIKEADHLVFIYPTWWGTFPALLKGFIDRVFLPGFAFKYRENSVLWDKLLKGKSARLIVTMDSPLWYYRLVYGSPGHNAMKKSTLKFCGVSPVKVTAFGPVKTAKKKKIDGWLKKVNKLGINLN